MILELPGGSRAWGPGVILWKGGAEEKTMGDPDESRTSRSSYDLSRCIKSASCSLAMHHNRLMVSKRILRRMKAWRRPTRGGRLTLCHSLEGIRRCSRVGEWPRERSRPAVRSWLILRPTKASQPKQTRGGHCRDLPYGRGLNIDPRCCGTRLRVVTTGGGKE